MGILRGGGKGFYQASRNSKMSMLYSSSASMRVFSQGHVIQVG